MHNVLPAGWKSWLCCDWKVPRGPVMSELGWWLTEQSERDKPSRQTISVRVVSFFSCDHMESNTNFLHKEGTSASFLFNGGRNLVSTEAPEAKLKEKSGLNLKSQPHLRNHLRPLRHINRCTHPFSVMKRVFSLIVCDTWWCWWWWLYMSVVSLSLGNMSWKLCFTSGPFWVKLWKTVGSSP